MDRSKINNLSSYKQDKVESMQNKFHFDHNIIADKLKNKNYYTILIQSYKTNIESGFHKLHKVKHMERIL